VDTWESLLTPPSGLVDGPHLDQWLTTIAERLLNGCHLLANGHKHRLVEIEMYYHAPVHPDPFAHKDPVQLHLGRWYFHRTRGTYRGGSFKGVDLAFGGDGVFAGALIRSMVRDDGTLIDGPSLCVDHLLTCTEMKTVAALDTEIANRVAWNQTSPLTLVASTPRTQPLVRSARVGLSLKRTGAGTVPSSYFLRPYRFLTEPRAVSKGKAHVVLAMALSGATVDEIHQRTGCPRKSIERYLNDLELGKQGNSFSEYAEKDLSTSDLCRMHGIWHQMRRCTTG